MNLKIMFLTVLTLLFTGSCGTKNAAADRSEVTPEQKAQKLMNAGDYAAAIEILEPLFQDNPKEYFRMPLLASAYAGYAGIDILSLITGQAAAGNSKEDSVFDQIDSFLPSDYDVDSLDYMDKAVKTLEVIPGSKMGAEGDPDYGESAEFELVLFRVIYTTMYVGLIKSGAIVLTVDDVVKILETLRNASADAGATGEKLAAAIDKTLDKIDAAEGTTDEEKFGSYIGVLTVSALQ